MKQIFLIHGSPEPGEIITTQEEITPDWFRWLQENIPNVVIPPMPLEIEVAYQDWVVVFEQYVFSNESILVGHSCGGGFVLRYISEHPEFSPAGVILVAPWLDPNQELGTDFMKFEVDPAVADRTDLHLFISSDDMESIIKTCELLRQKFPNAHWHEFNNRGHFCGKKEFPELLELLQ